MAEPVAESAAEPVAESVPARPRVSPKYPPLYPQIWGINDSLIVSLVTWAISCGYINFPYKICPNRRQETLLRGS